MTMPGGVFSTTYREDQHLIRTKLQWVWFLSFLGALFLLPLLGKAGWLPVVTIINITLIAVIGLQITTGYCGQLNLGQAAFMGVGAFTAAGFAKNFDIPFYINIPLAGLIVACVGAFFGTVSIRVKGFYLALITIAVHYVFSFSIRKLPMSWTGQSGGLRLEAARLGDLVIDTDVRLYYFVLLITCVCILTAWGIVRSRVGRAFVAIKDDDNAAQVIGVNVPFYKVQAFFVGCFYAGIAGATWAYYIRFIQIDQFTLWTSIWYMGMLIIGGLGSMLGAIIGTVLLRLFIEMITGTGPAIADLIPFLNAQHIYASMDIILGLLLIVFIMFEPRGLAYRWSVVKEAYRIWPFPR